MKKFLKLFLAVFFLSISISANAEEPKVLDETKKESNNLIMKYYQDILKLDKKYPGDLINEDFSQDIAANYPHLDDEKLFEQASDFRLAIRLYRFGNVIVEKYKQMRILPNDAPLVFDESQYDDGRMPAYQDSKKPLIITDFKKVISYGDDERDRKAIEYKKVLDRGDKKEIKEYHEFNEALKNLDFKKIIRLFLERENYFSDERGLGDRKSVV